VNENSDGALQGEQPGGMIDDAAQALLSRLRCGFRSPQNARPAVLVKTEKELQILLL